MIGRRRHGEVEVAPPRATLPQIKARSRDGLDCLLCDSEDASERGQRYLWSESCARQCDWACGGRESSGVQARVRVRVRVRARNALRTVVATAKGTTGERLWLITAQRRRKKESRVGRGGVTVGKETSGAQQGVVSASEVGMFGKGFGCPEQPQQSVTNNLECTRDVQQFLHITRAALYSQMRREAAFS